MKELKKLKEKLLTIKSRWSKEEETNAQNIEAVKAKLQTAKDALNVAEDPTEYAHASKTIEDAQLQLNFYQLQKTRFNHSFDETEYKNYLDVINKEYKLLTTEKGEEIRQLYKKLCEEMAAYDNDVREIIDTKNLLNEISGKPKESKKESYARDLSDISGNMRVYNNFADFCDYYERRYLNKQLRLSAGGAE